MRDYSEFEDQKFIEDVLENGKGCVESAYNLPYDYFADESRLVSIDDVADTENFEDSRIEAYEKEKLRDGMEKWLMRLHERLVFGGLNCRKADRRVLAFCLRYGLIDCNPRTLQETGQILDLSRERIRGICCKYVRILRHPKLHEYGDFGKALSDAANEESGVYNEFKRFNNYGELLEDYIDGEQDPQRKEKLIEIYNGYKNINAEDRFVREK